MMARAHRHVALFLKEPRLGRVKGRLARDIGAPAAWRFYRRLVRRVGPPLIHDPRWCGWIATTPRGWRGNDRFWPLAAPTVDQGPGDIGRRMRHVFLALPPGAAIIVGSDIPALRPHHIADGFRMLGRADVVLGPARDGGYWLIGLSARARRVDLFADVAWSTPRALEDTRRNIPRHLALGFAAMLSDVDDVAAYAIATHSISMSNSSGQDAMATKVRAGGSFGK